MRRTWKVAISAGLALGLSLALSAQAPRSGAMLAGPVEAVTEGGLTLQGIQLTFAPEARLATVTPDGTFVPVRPADLAPGDPLHAKFVVLESGPALVHGFVGQPFFWHGVVTAVRADGEGLLLGLELDGLKVIHASQARVVGVRPGHEGDSSMDGMAPPDGGVPADLVRVGATVGVKGIARGGVFAAAEINVAALTFVAGGLVSGILTGPEGQVVGIEITTRSDEAFQIAFDRGTLIWAGRRPVPPDVLREGMKVRVEGWTREDGTVLAREVQIQRDGTQGGKS